MSPLCTRELKSALSLAMVPETCGIYERRALLAKAPRTAGWFRFHTNDDVARLDFIRQLQGLDFSLYEIRQLLELRDHNLEW